MRTNVATSNFLSWFLYSVIIPLVPIGLGFFIVFLQTKKWEYNSLLSGTELFLLSLIIQASTKNDLEKLRYLIEESIILTIIANFILPLMIILTALVLSTVYIQENVTSLGFDRTLMVYSAVTGSIGTATICTPLQIVIAWVNAPRLTRSDVGEIK